MAFGISGAGIASIAISLVGAGVGAYAGRKQAKGDRKELNRKIRAKRLAARYSYSAKEASGNMMKFINNENARNSIFEVHRDESAQKRDVNDAAITAESKYQASGDMSLASGVSKGRKLIEIMVKTNKAKSNVTSKSNSIINNITDQKDSEANRINQETMNAYDKLTAILKDEGDNVDMISPMISGAQAGLNISSYFQPKG